MGSLDTIKSFNDFIERIHGPTDEYKFSVSSTRPLFLALSDSDDNGAIVLELFKDSNNNGVADRRRRVIAEHRTPFRRRFGDGSTRATTSCACKPNPPARGLPALGRSPSRRRGQHAENGQESWHRSMGSPMWMTTSAIEIRPTFTSSLPPPLEPSAPRSSPISAATWSLALISDANNNGVIDKNELLPAATLAPAARKN